MKTEEPEDPIDEIRRIVRNWWTAWMEDDKLETRLKCFILLGSEKFQIVAKHVFLEEISGGRCVPMPAIKKLINNFEEFVSSDEARLAAKEGIINCLRINDGKVYKIEKIKQYLKNFGIPENFLNSLEVKQAAEVAIANSLSSEWGNEEFYRISNFFFPYDLFSEKRHVYCQDVQRAAQKWILDCLNKGGVGSAKIASRIKNIGTKFGVPDIFYSSVEFELAIKEWILRFLYGYRQMSVDGFMECGYVDFTDQASEILLNTLKDEFGIEKIICSVEVQQVIKERRLAVKIISDEMKRKIETIRNNTRQGPF